MARQPYVSPLSATASCARCSFIGSTTDWKRHRCPGSMRIEQDGSPFGRFWTALVPNSRGKVTQGQVRKAAVVAGMLEPPRPMPDNVRAELREHNRLKRGRG